MAKNSCFSFVDGLLWLGFLAVAASAYLFAASGAFTFRESWPMMLGLILIGAWGTARIDRIRAFALRRSARYGLNAFILSLVLSGLFVVANILAYRSQWQVDFTEEKLNSLSEASINVLEALRKDVEILAFYQETSPARDNVKTLLELYSYHQPAVSVQFFDPDRHPTITREHGITAYDTVLIKCGESRKVVTGYSEYDFTNALIHVTRQETKKIYFMTGHGEKSIRDADRMGYTTAYEELRSLGYEVESFLPFQAEEVPPDCRVLVVAGPEIQPVPAVTAMIKRYLARGGNLLLLLDPHSPDFSGLLAPRGVKAVGDMIVDPLSALMGSDLTMPVISHYNMHDITRPFGDRFISFFSQARSILLEDQPPPGIRLRWLAQTQPSAWGSANISGHDSLDFVEGRDSPGPRYVVAVAVFDNEKFDNQAEEIHDLNGRIVIFGDSDFAANSLFNAQPGNGQFFLNSVNWLAGEEDLITVPERSLMERRVSMTEQEMLKVGAQVVFLYPLLFFIAAAYAWWRRW